MAITAQATLARKVENVQRGDIVEVNGYTELVIDCTRMSWLLYGKESWIGRFGQHQLLQRNGKTCHDLNVWVR